MPFMSAEHTKRIRDEIKKTFPKFKFSIRNRHYLSVNINILSGPIEMIKDQNNLRRNEQVNQFYIRDNYKDYPEIRDILLKIYEIANQGNGQECYDVDYGSIPDFYVHIEIGDWNKPYIVTEKKES